MFTLGQQVKVSDGTVKPPVHHAKRLRAWKANNFTGTVWATDEIEAYGKISVEPTRETINRGYFRLVRVVSVANTTPIEDTTL